jgi:8-oxo-dGTP diphosphatase
MLAKAPFAPWGARFGLFVCLEVASRRKLMVGLKMFKIKEELERGNRMKLLTFFEFIVVVILAALVSFLTGPFGTVVIAALIFGFVWITYQKNKDMAEDLRKIKENLGITEEDEFHYSNERIEEELERELWFGQREGSDSESKDKDIAYGGIVFNDKGEVLLRSPTNHWGGYVWTFAKGGREAEDRSPEETALREVWEETGCECEIVAPIPGTFTSDTCTTFYYLMKPTGHGTEHDKETEAVKWVHPDEAFELIQMTTNLRGRRRDTHALLSALEAWNQLIDT